MRKLGVWFAALATLLVLPLTAQAQTATDLWPNHLDNEWTYDVTVGGAQSIKVVDRSGGWARLDGFLGNHWFYMSTQSGRIWVWNSSTSRYSLVFNLTAGVGTDTTARADDLSCMDGAVYRVTDDNATITTPVGDFNGCTVLTMTRNPCADAGIIRMVFAPGVGLVEYTSQSIMGPRTARLNYAKVDGREYRPPATNANAGLSVCAGVDKASYASGATLNISFEVQNQTTEQVPFVFNSGQSFDFSIRDAQGQEVYRWSHGRFFTMALRSLTLLPGDTWTYRQGIDLKDRAGAALPAGNYIIEAVQTAGIPSSLRMRAAVSFRIR